MDWLLTQTPDWMKTWQFGVFAIVYLKIGLSWMWEYRGLLQWWEYLQHVLLWPWPMWEDVVLDIFDDDPPETFLEWGVTIIGCVLMIALTVVFVLVWPLPEWLLSPPKSHGTAA